MTDIAQFGAAVFIIIGLVNGVNLATSKEWDSFYLFCTAIVAGLIFGWLHWFGLPSAEIGLAVAIGSSGIYKTAQKIGGN